MKKLYAIFLTALVLLASCKDDEWDNNDVLSPQQQELIGTAVQFEPVVGEFAQTRKAGTTNHVGGFNTGDMMYIYRQYWNVQTNKWEYRTPPGTIYRYTDMNNGETDIFVKESWKVFENKIFHFEDAAYTDPNNPSSHVYEKKLTKGDSITWENGQTVRFRAWVLSTIGNSLADPGPTTSGITRINYPDYMVCDWVTVSGPTERIPMSMRHLGCRIGFYPREHNQFNKIEITYDPEDYRRDDNADTNGADSDDKQSDAESCAANVKAAYEKMCWPAGVDMDDLSLLMCSKDSEITTYKRKALSAAEIATDVKRPVFNSAADDRYYMISIPYDMSKEETAGDPIVLPPYTRFRVWLKDVNHGDLSDQTLKENNYHIFSLCDIKKKNADGSKSEEPMFPEGLPLLAGYSYVFTVGYNYRSLTVTAADNFSWTENELGEIASTDMKPEKPVSGSFSWWKTALSNACLEARAGREFQPTFSISNEQQWQEFIDLVNGNFNMNVDWLHKVVNIVTDPQTKKEIRRDVRWYSDVSEPDATGHRDTTWLEKSVLEEQGYIFYDHYTPGGADQVTKIEEDVLANPFSFYDNAVDRRWTINLTENLDFEDCMLDPVGKEATRPFAGNFNANGHLLKNVYIDGGTQHLKSLFGYVEDGYIKNIRLESLHPLSLTYQCTRERILGCSVLAPSASATLTSSAIGLCYFVGCIHEGDANGHALVENGDEFQMLGCMQAAKGIASGTAALATENTASEADEFIFQLPQYMGLDSVGTSNVMCNYYDIELSPGAKAFKDKSGTILPAGTDKKGDAVPFHRLQYIRGAETHILRAANNYLVDAKTIWKDLSAVEKREYYGVAPWRAMNWAIDFYNSMSSNENKCDMHYENSTIGYKHRYPVLKENAPTEDQFMNVLDQFN